MSTKKRKQGKRKSRWLPRLPPTVNAKQVVIGLLPYILIAWVGDKLGWLYHYCPGSNLFSRLVVLLSNAQMAFGQPFISFHPRDLLVGVAIAAAVRLVVAYRASNSRKFRHGREYGSARWGTPKDIAPFIDPVYENNIILTATERLTMNGRPSLPKYARNKNVIVIGGSGSGKTRFFVKPNLMQMPEKVSFVVTDPKGSLIIECGRMLVRGGCRVKVLNTINFAKSMHYNPFQYIRSEKDILKLVNALIANTKGDGEKAGEDFWVKSERLLFCALIGYLWYEAPEDEQNFTMLLELINAFEVREEDETFKNAIDLLFDDLARDKPDHFAVRQYAKFKLAAGKTAKSILISCGARLAPFDIAELRDLLAYDEMELDMIGDQRTALFIIVSDTDSTFNFVVAMMYSQLFNLLCDRADDVHGGRLPYHVRFLLDEFANIGQIPMFDKLIATIRSREMKELREKRVTPNIASYDSVYKSTLEPGMTLDSLYTKFNVERPEDFKGHSLSVSDVIVVNDEHGKTAWFVDSFGFTQLPDFFTQQEQQHEVPAEGEKTYPPVYRRTADYAREAGERDEYRASYQENVKCKQAIEKAISLDYDGQYLNDNAIFTVLDAFGPERLSWVLGNTITMKEHDGRFSRSNKAWAQAMSIPIDRDGFGSLRNWSYTVESHPAILDLYTTLLRKELERPPQERAAKKSVVREGSKPRQEAKPEPSKLVKHKSEPSL